MLSPQWLILAAIGGAVAIVLLIALRRRTSGPRARAVEPDLIEGLDEQRRRELIRGTSLHLRDLRYRYSIRPDRSELADHRAFTEEVNTVRLGFVPVIITDNRDDRQGYGYAAFVYDGRRWRGPGLPCPGGRQEALSHARRCVSPLDETE